MFSSEIPQDFQDPETFCMLGIDPGSVTVGFFILFVGIEDLQIKRYESFTLNLSKRPGGREIDEDLVESHGDVFVRLQELRYQLSRILAHYRPLLISCEAPFFSTTHPNAFEVLVQVIAMLRATLYEWSATKALQMITTTEAKKTIAPTMEPLKSQSKAIKLTKDRVRFNAEHSPRMAFVDLNLLDEHSLDAGVVVLTDYLRRVLGQAI